MTPLDQLGREVREAVGSGPSAERKLRQRTALLQAARRPPRRGRRYAVGALAAAAAALLIGVRMLAPAERLPGLAAKVEGRTLSEGEWLQVPALRALAVRVSDGSELRLGPHSTARLLRLARPEARWMLEQGSLQARVRPASASGTSWVFDAGPFHLSVLGTAFALSWDAGSLRLSVVMQHGRVRVRGGSLGAEGLVLEGGDRLDVVGSEVRLRRHAPHEDTAQAPEPPGETPASAPASAEAAPASAEAAQAQAQAARAASAVRETAARGGGQARSWKELARQGQHRAALRAAERRGFASLVDQLDSEELSLLADAARLSGASARARQTLRALRRRFPDADAAHMAAFRLGRLAVDADNNHAQAAHWFAEYLRTDAAGPFAAEALGRLIETRSKTGDHAGARAAAQQYLARFPNGPYARAARQLVHAPR